MKKYAFINSSGDAEYTASPATDDTYIDGEIYNGLMCREIPQAADDTEVIERWYWVDDGHFVRPPKPTDFHDWSSVTKSWLPNLDAAREAQRQAWNAWRDRELIAGYTHNGHVFHSDDRFTVELQLILKGYEREQLTGTSAIRTRYNAVLQMTHAEIEGLLLLIGLHRQAVYAQSWAEKDALAGLTTLESIMAGGPPS